MKDYFWPKVEKTDGCWLWRGTVDKDGYGRCYVRTRKYGAHRHSWFLAYGPIPDGMLVLHKCNVPACVNPGHLYLGTHADNAADKVRQGRHIGKGGSGKNKKISYVERMTIYSRILCGETGVSLAKEYGVVPSVISKCKKWCVTGDYS